MYDIFSMIFLNSSHKFPANMLRKYVQRRQSLRITLICGKRADLANAKSTLSLAIQLRIKSILLHKFLVIALLDNITVTHNKYHISLFDG